MLYKNSYLASHIIMIIMKYNWIEISTHILTLIIRYKISNLKQINDIKYLDFIESFVFLIFLQSNLCHSEIKLCLQRQNE